MSETLDFEDFIECYPKREGSQRWGDARRHWNARLKEGHTAEQMVDGAKRYSAYCEFRRITNTPYVQQAATFLGRNLSFMEPWVTIPSGVDEQRVLDAFATWLPMLPEVDVITDDRRAKIAALVSRYPKARDSDWWSRYFAYIHDKCKFLIGQNDKGWKASFDWLIDENNFEKVKEGQYQK